MQVSAVLQFSALQKLLEASGSMSCAYLMYPINDLFTVSHTAGLRKKALQASTMVRVAYLINRKPLNSKLFNFYDKNIQKLQKCAAEHSCALRIISWCFKKTLQIIPQISTPFYWTMKEKMIFVL